MGLFKKSGIDFIIAGLGNPGLQYENTRHNAGFMFIDRAAEKYGFKVNKLKHFSLCSVETVEGCKVLIMKPQTYMNDSGRAIVDAANYYKIPAERIIIAYDDIALPPGGLRIRRKGSAGGHNGVKFIINCLGTDAFPRIRIGVGSPAHPENEMIDFVLGVIPDSDKKLILPVLSDAFDAARMIIAGDFESAMNRYNKRGIGANAQKLENK